ncbi:LysR family transcriptional regulator [Neoroseomonas soli]|uniref:LysR family transcriptional regulator n=1 Tax=Neoroseomonas soli TaxID=1081025 RepID=A0A9X9WR97_9PROT|nr:LysR family transcriptional regulator [Neoroseomonas soli]MBR0669676.1 LysR family transcriptional regulator [Neoroseomonas soli]
MRLTYRQLEILHAVARHGTVTAAAETLGVSQPAVSMMLRESQAAIGFPLFGRRKGRLHPTAELSVILAEMDRVFQGVARIDRLIDGIRDMTVGSVVAAATPTLADHLLPRAVAAFRRSRPGIQVALQTMDNLGVIEAVVRERVDLGFVLTPLVAPDLQVVALDETELVCAVPTSHPLAGRDSVAVRDLPAWPLIGVGRGLPLGDLVEAAFAAEGLRRRIAIEVTQTSVALSLVRAGAGIAIVDPYGAMSGVPADLTLLRLHPRVSVGAAAIVQRGRALSRAARLLLATTRRVASMRNSL